MHIAMQSGSNTTESTNVYESRFAERTKRVTDTSLSKGLHKEQVQPCQKD
jgi:hypothetical protein